jgi:hypothetical protein
MSGDRGRRMLPPMPTYLLHHTHEPDECRASYSAWKGFESPLRGRPALSTCVLGDHETWWRVEAADIDAALALLPAFVAERTTPIHTREVQIP